jgi:hypothetical protein
MSITPERLRELRAQISAQAPPRRTPYRQRLKPITSNVLTVHDLSEPEDHPMHSETAHAEEAARAAVLWGMRNGEIRQVQDRIEAG